MPKSEQVEVLTPGSNEKCYLAGALDMYTGTIVHCLWWRKTQGLFVHLLDTLDRAYASWMFAKATSVVSSCEWHPLRAGHQT